MRAYEFPVKVTEEGNLELPERLADVLPRNQTVRVIVLVPEPEPYDDDLTPEEEDRAWAQFGAQQLARFYGEEDEIYDRL